jgi:hypothetical protein
MTTQETAIAGQKNQGYLLVFLSVGLDLLPPTVCAGCRTLASVQNFGSRDPFSMKLALIKYEHKQDEPCVLRSALLLQGDCTEIRMGL